MGSNPDTVKVYIRVSNTWNMHDYIYILYRQAQSQSGYRSIGCPGCDADNIYL